MPFRSFFAVSTVLVALACRAQAPAVPTAAGPWDASGFSAKSALLLGADHETMHALPPIPEAAIEAVRDHNAGRRGTSVQVGVHRQAHLKPAESRWKRLPDGSLATRLTVTSTGAPALRTALRVPAAGQVHLRFEGREEAVHVSADELRAARGAQPLYWSPVTSGEMQSIEVVLGPEADTAEFAIEGLSHFVASPWEDAGMPKAAASCEVDVACHPDLSVIKNAVAKLIFTSDCGAGGGQATCACSGTLMNDRSRTFTPYVIAARSCIPSQQVAGTLTSLWFYERAACGASVDAAGRVQVSGGAALLYDNAAEGVAFLRLNSPAPGGAVFSGWDAGRIADNTEVVSIHHPVGDPKKASRGRVREVGIDQASGAVFAVVSYRTGTAEPGSPGGGLFSTVAGDPGSHHYRGFFYGGYSNCSNSGDTTHPDNADHFTTFETLYPKLRPWLDPVAPEAGANYSDIWWNPGESGWGLTIADHETQLFGVWYTYRDDGQPMWYVIPGGTFSQGRRIFSGDLYRTSGPPHDTVFDPSRVTVTKVGAATIDFAPSGLAPGSALFSYSLEGVSRTKRIERYPFGDAEALWGGDYTDIWWDPAESGWGMTLAQQGANIFGVWYIYGTDGQPLFVVLPGGTFETTTRFTGTLYTSTGPSFRAAAFDSSQVRVTPVGSATIELEGTPGNGVRGFLPRARVTTQINGRTQVKQLTRHAFGNPSPRVAPVPKSHVLVVTFGRSSSIGSQPGTGSVASTPAGLRCPTVCQASFPAGTMATLTAAPSAGSRFTGFTGACSGTTCVVPMSAAAHVIANFERLPAPSTLAISAVPLPDARAGEHYSALAATAQGGVPPYTFLPDSFANGTPPPGMGVSVNGFLEGTPSASITRDTTYTFGICVRDLAGTQKCLPNTVNIIARNAQGGFAGNWSGTYEETVVSTGTTAAPYANYTLTCRGTWRGTATPQLAFQMILNNDVQCVYNNGTAPFVRFAVYNGQIPNGGGQTILNDAFATPNCPITAVFSLPKGVTGSAVCHYPNNGSGQSSTRSISIAGQ